MKHEDGYIFEQQEETEAIRMNVPSLPSTIFYPITCLMIIDRSINETASYNWSRKIIPLNRRRQANIANPPRFKMLTTTLIVLSLMATCYSLALVCATQNQQDQHPAQQVFRNTHNSRLQMKPKPAPAEGNSIVVSGDQKPNGNGLRRERRSPDARRVAPADQPTGADQHPRSAGRQMGSNRQTGGSLEAGTLEQAGSAVVASAGGSRPSNSLIRNVTAQNGQSVVLHCIVEPSSELVVSWFRGTGEPQLLTYESNTVIDDQRFVVRQGIFKDDDWALQIKNLDKAADSGLYQCQTNSEPPQSQFYQLNIIEPQVNILGAPDMAVKLGSTINLTCTVSQWLDQSQPIFWYINDRMINYDINGRGKIVISKGGPERPDTLTSNLQIFHSKLPDSGNYTCSPANARSMSIYVHVLEGLDKRLIMFQNDNFEPSAASSQQTNSALSVHVVRLTRGRVYALFVAYVIFASWFQLVAQAQTAISLLLLSVIGFFLGKVTDDNHYQVDKKAAKHTGEDAATESNSSPPGSIHKTRSTSNVDPLLERANSALNLLKSLSSGSSSSSEDDDTGSKQRPHRTRRGHTKQHQELPNAQAVANHQKGPLNSPSAISSSSSSGSTGYNSDSRSTNLIVVHPIETDPHGCGHTGSLQHKRRRCRHYVGPSNRPQNCHMQEEAEMIELVSEPTAMNLVMEEFEQQGTIRRHQQPPRPLVLKSASSLSLSPVFSSLTGSPTPVKPPRIELQPHERHQGAHLTDQDEDEEEPHYSSPTNTLTAFGTKAAKSPTS